MNNNEFNKIKRLLNKQYFEIFGEIPCMQNFSCSREDYITALKTAIESKTKLEEFLKKTNKPINKDVLI